LGLGRYIWLLPANRSLNALTFDFDKDIANLNKSTPLVTYSASTDISKFKNRGGKIIWYHGLSDPGPPVLGTIEYYKQLAARAGGLAETKKFARLFLIPNMGHCSGGPATDQFDMLTPLIAWVEQGIAPNRIRRLGHAFHRSADHAQQAALSLSGRGALHRPRRRRPWYGYQLCLRDAEVIEPAKDDSVLGIERPHQFSAFAV
jgi:hypothetical protein